MEIDVKLYTAKQVIDAMLSDLNSSLIVSSDFRATLLYIDSVLLKSRRLTIKRTKKGLMIKINGWTKLYLVHPLKKETECHTTK